MDGRYIVTNFCAFFYRELTELHKVGQELEVSINLFFPNIILTTHQIPYLRNCLSLISFVFTEKKISKLTIENLLYGKHVCT